MAPCSKLSRSCMVWGSVSATTVAPRSAAAVPAASWPQAPSGFMAETPSTFQLTGRSASSDMVARKSMSSSREAVEAAGHDQLDRRALVLAHGGGQALHLLPGRRPRGDGLAVAVVVRVDLRGREAERALLAAPRAAPPPWRPGPRASAVPPDGALAHDEAAQRRVADEEAGVHGDAPVEAADPVAEGAPVPGQAGAQRGQRHALDPRHHPRDVVDVLGRHGRQREAAVAAEHRGHAVQRGRAGVGVPEQLRVVVGVQVDEARA